jgi:hypothetical protein
MRTKNKKLLGAAAVAGVVAMTGSAFTAGGLGGNPAAAFVGGSVVQSVEGSSVTSVVYDTDEAANRITSVTLTFGNELVDGKTPTIAFTGGNGKAYTCTQVALVAGSNTSVCSPSVVGETESNTVATTKITVA